MDKTANCGDVLSKKGIRNKKRGIIKEKFCNTLNFLLLLGGGTTPIWSAYSIV